MSGTPRPSPPIEGLAIPEDDPTPNSPFLTLADRQVQALHLDRHSSQIAEPPPDRTGVPRRRARGPLLSTSTVIVEGLELCVHVDFLCLSGEKESRRVLRRPHNRLLLLSHHVIRGCRAGFGWSPLAAETGAPNRAATPVGFILRCFHNQAPRLRQTKNARLGHHPSRHLRGGEDQGLAEKLPLMLAVSNAPATTAGASVHSKDPSAPDSSWRAMSNSHSAAPPTELPPLGS